MNPIVLDANLRMPVLWKDVAKGSRESAGAYRNFRAAVRDYLGEGYVTVYPGCTAAWDTISGSVQKRVVQFSMNGPVPALASVPSVFIEPGDLTWYDCDQVWYSAMDMETGRMAPTDSEEQAQLLELFLESSESAFALMHELE